MERGGRASFVIVVVVVFFKCNLPYLLSTNRVSSFFALLRFLFLNSINSTASH